MRKKIKKIINNKEFNIKISNIFSSMSDPVRLKIMLLLLTEEKNVSSIVENLEVSQSDISHHLRVLRNLRLVKFRKDGRFIYYSLDDNHIVEIIKICIEHIEEEINIKE